MASKREAESAARRAFPEFLVLGVTHESTDERGRNGWSFGALRDANEERELVGYVHADGSIKGLY